MLEELVRRAVEAVQPRRIILFGSAARGTMNANSDLDALVIIADGSDCLTAMQTLHVKLSDLGIAKNLVVVEASDVERHAENPYLIIHTALLEGKELYRAAS
ncbi:MAG TPA: nucleotidyltransferase domain-containing protein [Pirellulales bacterium]|nr:nucleotidyltransferase domain-containing protein [Pirellulales bacterium]